MKKELTINIFLLFVIAFCVLILFIIRYVNDTISGNFAIKLLCFSIAILSCYGLSASINGIFGPLFRFVFNSIMEGVHLILYASLEEVPKIKLPIMSTEKYLLFTSSTVTLEFMLYTALQMLIIMYIPLYIMENILNVWYFEGLITTGIGCFVCWIIVCINNLMDLRGYYYTLLETQAVANLIDEFNEISGKAMIGVI